MKYNSNRQKMAHWITRQYYKFDGSVTRVMLSHINGQRRDNKVEDFPVGPGKSDEQLADLAIDLEGAALDHADAFPGLQSYKLSAFIMGEEKAASNTTIKISVYDEDGEDSSSEPPTIAGLQQQHMRMVESLFRTTIVGQLQHQKANENLIARLDERNQRLEDRQFKSIEMLETLLSQQHERDLATRQADAKLEDRREMVGIIKQLAPVIASRMTKNKMLAGAVGNPLKTAVWELLDQLTKEQIDSLLEVLGDDQGEIFGDLILRCKDSKNADLLVGFRQFATSLTPPQSTAVNSILTPIQRITVSEILGLYNQQVKANGKGQTKGQTH